MISSLFKQKMIPLLTHSAPGEFYSWQLSTKKILGGGLSGVPPTECKGEQGKLGAWSEAQAITRRS